MSEIRRSTLHQLEQAALSIGLLDAELRRSPVKSIWHHRQLVDAAVRAAALEGYVVEKNRLLALSIGLPLTVMFDEGAHRTALGLLRVSLCDHAALEFDDHLQDKVNEMVTTIERMVAMQGGSLLALADVGYREPNAAFALAVPQFLRRRVSTELLAGICGIPAARTAIREIWTERFLETVRSEATLGRHRLLALELSWARWARLAEFDRRRSDSNLSKVLMIVASTGLASPAHVARRLKISDAASARLLDELAEHGVLVELSKRRNWRVFTTEDQASIGDSVIRPHKERLGASEEGTPELLTFSGPSLPLPPLPEVDFSAAIADVDAVLRRIENRLNAQRSAGSIAESPENP